MCGQANRVFDVTILSAKKHNIHWYCCPIPVGLYGTGLTGLKWLRIRMSRKLIVLQSNKALIRLNKNLVVSPILLPYSRLI